MLEKKGTTSMQSNAKTVDEYLSKIPEDRKNAIQKVREVILANLPEGIVETMNWGMISYEVPLSVYPDTYNGKSLSFAGLASQKNHMAVYLSSIYATESNREKFEKEYQAFLKRLKEKYPIEINKVVWERNALL